MNYILLGHSSGFNLYDLIQEDLPSGTSILSVFYSFHSDDDIQLYGHKAFANSFTNDTDWSSKIKQTASFYSSIVSVLYSRYEIYEREDCHDVYSPLMIDMAGNGIKLSDPNKGMNFDLTGDGLEQKISCPLNSGTPFIALPNEIDGEINNINELFGNHTMGPDGRKADNGFLALAKYDNNQDGLINNEDAIYKKLRLWDESNCDGIASDSELKTLEEAGVVEIDLLYHDIFKGDVYGNVSKQHSFVKTANGKRSVFDVWFTER